MLSPNAGLAQLRVNTFRMFCVWMQDNPDILQITKLLEDLPKIFLFWVKWKISMEQNQATNISMRKQDLEFQYEVRELDINSDGSLFTTILPCSKIASVHKSDP